MQTCSLPVQAEEQLDTELRMLPNFFPI